MRAIHSRGIRQKYGLVQIIKVSYHFDVIKFHYAMFQSTLSVYLNKM